jgi:hypothetical protein
MFAEATALWAQHQALILATIGVIALQSALLQHCRSSFSGEGAPKAP